MQGGWFLSFLDWLTDESMRLGFAFWGVVQSRGSELIVRLYLTALETYVVCAFARDSTSSFLLFAFTFTG